jgi:hypothetical protein
MEHSLIPVLLSSEGRDWSLVDEAIVAHNCNQSPGMLYVGWRSVFTGVWFLSERESLSYYQSVGYGVWYWEITTVYVCWLSLHGVLVCRLIFELRSEARNYHWVLAFVWESCLRKLKERKIYSFVTRRTLERWFTGRSFVNAWNALYQLPLPIGR